MSAVKKKTIQQKLVDILIKKVDCKKFLKLFLKSRFKLILYQSD